MMRRVGLVALFVLLTPGVFAQPAALNDQQQLGQLLFTQSCGVCHLKPQINANLFGPPLSKDSAGGRDEVMRQVIMNGTPRMPGFKYHFEPAQIDAVIAYLKTVPTSPPATPR